MKKQMSSPSISIAGKSYAVPVDFTLGELRAAKSHFGAHLISEYGIDSSDPDILCALAYIVMHRVDPSVTPSDVEALSVGDLNIDGGDGDGMDPTPPQP